MLDLFVQKKSNYNCDTFILFIKSIESLI